MVRAFRDLLLRWSPGQYQAYSSVRLEFLQRVAEIKTNPSARRIYAFFPPPVVPSVPISFFGMGAFALRTTQTLVVVKLQVSIFLKGKQVSSSDQCFVIAGFIKYVIIN